MRVVKYNDRIQVRVKREEKQKAEELLFKKNMTLADFFREKLEELLRGK